MDVKEKLNYAIQFTRDLQFHYVAGLFLQDQNLPLKFHNLFFLLGLWNSRLWCVDFVTKHTIIWYGYLRDVRSNQLRYLSERVILILYWNNIISLFYFCLYEKNSWSHVCNLVKIRGANDDFFLYFLNTEITSFFLP